jgi:RHS repeat-associated protein
MGSFEPDVSRWAASASGVVIKLTALESDGRARVEGATLSDEERLVLGRMVTEPVPGPTSSSPTTTVYKIGDELWRLPVDHFSDWDPNHGTWWPDKPGAPKAPESIAQAEENPDCASGSLIECENATLGERIALNGAPISLVYRSDRAEGHRVGYGVDLTLGPSTTEGIDQLLRIELAVDVAGRHIVKVYKPTRSDHTDFVNLRDRFEWDGLSATGEKVHGPQHATATISYVYRPTYTAPATFGATGAVRPSFTGGGGSGGGAGSVGAITSPVVTTIPARTEIKLTQLFPLRPLGTFQWTGLGLGGWSIDHYHAWNAGKIILGSGGEISANETASGAIVRHITPLGYPLGGPSGANAVRSLGATSSGATLYYIGGNGEFYRRRLSDAAPEALPKPAGVGAGEHFSAVAVTREDDVYVCTGASGNDRIWQLNADLSYTHVAGGGSPTIDDGDGGSATAARIHCAAMAADRGLIFVGSGAVSIGYPARVRRIDIKANRIDNYAGCAVPAPGVCSTTCTASGFMPDGSSCGTMATDTRLADSIGAVATAPNGDVYFALVSGGAAVRVHHVTTSGRMSIVAGNGLRGAPKNGIAAISSPLSAPVQLAVDSNGTLLIAANGEPGHIVSVKADGVLRFIAGHGAKRLFGDKSAAADLDMHIFTGLAVGGGLTSDGLAAGETIYAAGRSYINHTFANDVPTMVAVQSPIPWDASIVANGSEVYVARAGRHVETRDAATGVIKWEFVHDAAGRLIAVRDRNGNVTTLFREAGSPLVTKIFGPFAASSAPLGAFGVTHLGFDTAGRLARVERSLIERHAFTYAGSSGLLRTFTPPGGDVASGETHTFDYVFSTGRLSSDSQPGSVGGSLALARKPLEHGWEMSLTDVLGHVRTYRNEYVTTTGGGVEAGTHVRKLIAADKTATDIVVDNVGVSETKLANGVVITTEQMPDPRFGLLAPVGTEKFTLPSGKTRVVSVARTLTPSSLGDPLLPSDITEVTNVSGADSAKKEAALAGTFTRKLIRASDGTFIVESTSAMGRIVRLYADTRGRVTRVELPGSAVDDVRIAYDSLGRVDSVAQGGGAGTRVVTNAYKPSGLLDSVTANTVPPFATSFPLQDSLGRVKQQVLPGGATVAMEFDLRGNFGSISPPSRPAHLFSFTMVDQPASYTAPAAAPSPAPLTSYLWNRDGTLGDVILADGKKIVLGYDPLGRLETVSDERAPERSARVKYDDAARVREILWPLSAPTASMGFEYDGALLTKTTWNGSIWGSTTTAQSVGHRYNNLFQREGLTVFDGPEVVSLYDRDGLLTRAGALTLTYANASKSVLVDSAKLGTVDERFVHNAFGELKQQSATASSTHLLTIDYEPAGAEPRDRLGRIIAREETVFAEAKKRHGYEYDSAGRLWRVRVDGTLRAEYTYDPNGNRKTKTSWSGATATIETSSYDDQDRLSSVGSATYTYLATGEVDEKRIGGVTVAKYRWDGRGQLLSVELPAATDGGVRRVEYILDALGRRVGRRVVRVVAGVETAPVLTKQWLWGDALRIVGEIDIASGMRTTFVYAGSPNLPAYAVRSDGKSHRILGDHLGSLRLVVDSATGVPVQRMDYDEFGIVTTETTGAGSSPLPFGFAGGLYDRDTKLVSFGTRDYDAVTGRWISKDPAGFDGGLNFFEYANGDPINFVDFDGESATMALPFFGAGVGGSGSAGALGGSLGAAAPVAAVLGAGVGGFAVGWQVAKFLDKQVYERFVPQTRIEWYDSHSKGGKQNVKHTDLIGVPIDELIRRRDEAKRRGDTKEAKRIDQHLKGLGERNKAKRGNKKGSGGLGLPVDPWEDDDDDCP